MRKLLAFLPWVVVPFALTLDTAMSLALGWRPYGTIETILLAAISVVSLIAVVSLLLPAGRALLRRRAGECALVLLSATVGWALLEGGAHVLEKKFNTKKAYHTRGPEVTWVFRPHPELFMGIEGPSTYTTDRRGIRATYSAEPHHEAKVLCIGGSTTECTYLDNWEQWPALIMKDLNGGAEKGPYWVGNVGISGYATWQHVEFAESSPLLEGIDLLVVQAGINDMWRSISGEEEEIRYDRFTETLAQSRKPHAEEAVLEARTPWWSRSRVIQLWHTLRQPPPPAHHFEGVMGDEYYIRREKRKDAKQTDALPDLSAGLSGFRERVRGIIDACRDRGTKVVFTTQPVLWRDDLTPELKDRFWFGWTPDGKYLTVPRLREAIDQYNAAVREVCAEAGVPVVDLDSMNGHAAYFYDDCHFTEAGARAVAARVAPVVREALAL